MKKSGGLSLLPGHVDLIQVTSCVLSPSQFEVPLHVLLLTFTPVPHVTEQLSQALHGSQPPGTANISRFTPLSICTLLESLKPISLSSWKGYTKAMYHYYLARCFVVANLKAIAYKQEQTINILNF